MDEYFETGDVLKFNVTEAEDDEEVGLVVPVDPEDPQVVFDYAEALLQGSTAGGAGLFPYFLNIGIDEEEIIDLQEVVDYIEAESDANPGLELRIDLDETEDFAEYDEKDGELSIEANED